eukprot:jgi/Tetstr1/425782/TSEL_001565.t1
MAAGKKTGKKTGGKAKKWPLPPGHVSSIHALESYMNKVMHGPLRTGLEAVSGDNTLPAAEALLLIADFLTGTKAAQAAVQQRLDSYNAMEPGPEPGNPKGLNNEAKGRLDHPIVTSLTRAIERTMMAHPPTTPNPRCRFHATPALAAQLRLGWSETDSPLLELSRQLMAEAHAHAAGDPQHFLSPSIPAEESFSLHEFRDAIGEAVMHTSQLVNTGSMLMVVEYRLAMVEGGAQEDSLALLTRMVEGEAKAIRGSAGAIGGMMMRAIQRQRRVGGMLSGDHRREVSVGLDDVRGVVGGTVTDIIANLEGIKDIIQMSASSQRLKELEDAADAEATAEGGPDAAEGGPSSESALAAEAPEGKAAADEVAAADQAAEAEGEEAPTDAAPADAPLAAEEGDSADGLVPGEQAVKILDQMIETTQSAMDTAMQHLSEMVEGAAYDKAADLFAEIAREERAVVKLLSIRKWQTKLELSQSTLQAGIRRVMALLRTMAADREGDPPPRSERGREAAARPPPFFEALTLLTSAMCRCIGDAERSVGVGLQEEQEEAQPAPVSPDAPLTYTQALEKLRSSVGADLEEGIAATQGGGRAVCRALQRLQSRLMHCLQSSDGLSTVSWDAGKLAVVPQGSAGASTEAAAAVPLLRASQELRAYLADAWRGDGVGGGAAHQHGGAGAHVPAPQARRAMLGLAAEPQPAAAEQQPEPQTSDEDAEAEAALAADLAAAQGEPAAPAAEVPPEAEAATGGLPADVALALRAVTSVVEAIKGEMQA